MKKIVENELEFFKDPRSIQRDACGVGFVAHLQGNPSHDIIVDGLTVLSRLDHRGGRASDGKTGDGAGIMMQIPDQFFRERQEELGFTLPDQGNYAVGMIFLPKDPKIQQELLTRVEAEVVDCGQTCLGFRQVPVDDSCLGEIARASEPAIKQVFVARGEQTDAIRFEWELYRIRKRLEEFGRARFGLHQTQFYFPSFSSRTLIYKGLLLSHDIANYYVDLQSDSFKSGFALVHQRFSTNTLPAWPLAQPFRFLGHNGEINTLRGNVNWMKARSAQLKSRDYSDTLQDILPITTPAASDSAILDNTVEFLLHTKRSFPHVLSMLIPEPWEGREDLTEDLKAFYEFQSCLMEPWDGPAFVGFSDGQIVGARLDRNGLRPGRYWVTIDGRVIMSSEAGVLDIASSDVVYKGRLSPGRMFVVDMNAGQIVSDESIKEELQSAKPYRQWIRQHMVHLEDLSPKEYEQQPAHTYTQEQLFELQMAFGYSKEDLRMLIAPMCVDGKEPISSMGNDAPLAVLSRRHPLLYNYFKQLFAQVTNPPIDAIREELVTSLSLNLGPQGNLFDEDATHCRQLRLNQPILTDAELNRVKSGVSGRFKSCDVSMLLSTENPNQSFAERMEEICQEVKAAIAEGTELIILTDRGAHSSRIALPALLSVSAVHHFLIREGMRTKCSLILESAEPREVHHFALLIGYGADAVNPYLVFATIFAQRQEDGFSLELSPFKMQQNYIKAVGAGLLKVMSKMGISTLQSYRGAQIFEAVGLAQDFVDKYFSWTPSRIGGIGLEDVEVESRARQTLAFEQLSSKKEFLGLPVGGQYHWRRDGEEHLHSPAMVAGLQNATQINSREQFRDFCKTIDDQNQRFLTLRGLFQFKTSETPVPIEEVEDVKSIVKRFSTGAMSFGSISKESHETIAIAMNRMGAKSNSGEGGEDPSRFEVDAEGNLRRSAIKQVASGRFGVTSHYLVNADELQIKIAQGAKPGEGGQLPGHKVDKEIARTRYSTPGVPLISPPPHHDIYSIEDLAQLIFDLKNANKHARVSVKLVSAVGVGTIASGVAKAKADTILISGYEGGTGASPATSIKHAGLPWELGLAETHRSLVENNLRSRVILQADGQLRTPRDIAIATMLGAEQWGVGTGALVVLGCIMMRKCHLNTCPVGIATQDPELRKKFAGKPEHLINYFFLLAEGLREIMAELGVKTVDQLVGRSDLLQVRSQIDHPKAAKLDLSDILSAPNAPATAGRYCQTQQDHGIEKLLDETSIIPNCQIALRSQTPVSLRLPVKNINRTVGTLLSAEVSRRYGADGLPDDTIRLHLYGAAGQSLMAFGARGITCKVEGEVNDYCGKGLSGAKVIVVPPHDSSLIAENNIICGNTTLYGATSGSLFVRGIAGERFAVRNSGAEAVVEGVGDHGCEYMTGGRVIVLGATGRNFAAGMSGGIAFVLNHDGEFVDRVNQEMVELSTIEEKDDLDYVLSQIRLHYALTDSRIAAKILDNWSGYRKKFVRVMPIAFKRALLEMEREKSQTPITMVERSFSHGDRFEQGGLHG